MKKVTLVQLAVVAVVMVVAFGCGRRNDQNNQWANQQCINAQVAGGQPGWGNQWGQPGWGNQWGQPGWGNQWGQPGWGGGAWVGGQWGFNGGFNNGWGNQWGNQWNPGWGNQWGQPGWGQPGMMINPHTGQPCF